MFLVRRFALALGLLAASSAPAQAATLAVVPRDFSPANGSLAISATVPEPQTAGVELASPKGERLGWILPPGRLDVVSLFWDGRLNGVAVNDGSYSVRLVSKGRVLARMPIRIDSVAPRIENVSAGNGGTPFAGDGPLLTTISPNGDGFRDRALIRFTLREPAAVTLELARTVKVPGPPVYSLTKRFAAGTHAFAWEPAPTLLPRTYVVHLRVADDAGNASDYGPQSAYVGRTPRTPVVRVQGVDAGFTRASYAPGQVAVIQLSTDAPRLTLQVFRSGPEHVLTGSESQLNGVAVTQEVAVDWSRFRSSPGTIRLGIGPWRSGLYYAQLSAPDGRIGYAPFVVRPARFGEYRVAVVLPTSTWQAYNFYDADGNGFGDTWYAGAPNQSVKLGRPYLRRGVIPFFRRYDLAFLHWLAWGGKQVDYVADSDLAFVPDGDALATAYDLVVFPGHTEYVTEHVFDVIERYRDVGGNLMFLSANNFFWQVRSEDGVLRKVNLFRKLGRPESALLGVQYLANDEGSRQGLFTVTDPALAPWLWAKTGLEEGGSFGEFVGGYGIEIDATTPSSPPGTTVVATVPDLFGPARTAQMAIYETPTGAKVFAAGALDFGGTATFWPVTRMLENLWSRYAVP